MATTLTSTGITFTDGTSINSAADAAGGTLYGLGTITYGVQARTLTAGTRTHFSIGTTIAGSSLVTDLYIWNSSYSYREHVGEIRQFQSTQTSFTIPSSNTAYNYNESSDVNRNTFNVGQSGSWKALGNFQNWANASIGIKVWGGTFHWRYA